MPLRDSHEVGSFSWAELGTSDPAAAKEFYGGLFGWTFEDKDAGPGSVYTVCNLDGSAACALVERGVELEGTPPAWLSYVTVEDIDQAAQNMAAGGATLLKEPFDVGDSGRMALVIDPAGARFALWQPKGAIGAEVMQDPGSLRWNELFTSDIDRAGKFYVETLGWASEAVDMGPKGTYTLFSRPGEREQAAGMVGLPPEMAGVPPHWMVYFSVADVDEATEKVAALGGKTLVPAVDIPVGRFAIVQDPQGATFGVFKDPF